MTTGPSVPPATLRTLADARTPRRSRAPPPGPAGAHAVRRRRPPPTSPACSDDPGDPATDLTWSVGPDNVPAFTEGKAGTACCTPESIAAHPARPRERRRAPSTLAIGPQQPAHDATWARNLGITTQISTFTTRYPAGQARVVNIHRIADIVRGMVIAPGETWSLNGSVGPAHGGQGLRRRAGHLQRRARQRHRRRRQPVRHHHLQRRVLRRARLRGVPEPLALHQPLPLRPRGHGVVEAARPQDQEHHALRHPHLADLHRARR